MKTLLIRLLLAVLFLHTAVCAIRIAVAGDAPRSLQKANITVDLRDVIGVAHVSGRYHLTEEDFLNEGSRQILALGSRVIKVYFTVPKSVNPYFKVYPFRSDWPRLDNFVDLARTPYFQALFDRPFTTYILTVYGGRQWDHYWINGITDAQAAEEERRFHDLARHFLTTYRGTGKTFVFQHWEGDWAIRGNFDHRADPTAVAIQGMVRWLNARQSGVDRARKEIGCHGVQVYHAAEVNLVKPCMIDGRPGVANKVLPHTRVDLVSYSSWEAQSDRAELRRALDYIAQQVADKPPFGDRNVYIGEFGAPQNELSPQAVQSRIRNVVEVALEFGCPYIVYWQLYCNELASVDPPPLVPVRSNKAVRGFWLVRPDGSKAWPWQYLGGVLAQ
jgi:hypothetical protein